MIVKSREVIFDLFLNKDYVMRVAYFILFITLALMTWAVSVQAEAASLISINPVHAKLHQFNEFEDLSPCSFNLLCSCSKPGPSEFGIVSCHGVPFANVPQTLNTSRAFILSMAGNSLQVLEENRLVFSGLWRLEIRDNQLYHIAEDAFTGLTKVLTELDLQNNELTSIPTMSIRKLAKIRVLNLNGNKIADVYPENFEGVSSTLSCLSLAGNLITNIPAGAFGNLLKLEKLDLSGNSIQLVHNEAFHVASRNLDHLYLSHNLLQKIPFEALSILKLKYLDLSHNLLSSTFDEAYKGKLNVGRVIFDNNRIESLPPFSFQNFKQVKSVSFAFNPIDALVEDSFKDSNVEDLDLSNCYIEEIEPKAFRGLEKSLETLDLSFNNITMIPVDLFDKFDGIRVINLDKNRIQVIPDQFLDFQYSLHRFSLIEDSISSIPLEDIRVMRNLRSLNLSSFGSSTISSSAFEGFGLSVEDLKITHAKVTSVRESAFMHLTGLKSLDLSDNRIGKIDAKAFDEVGHSLTKLKITNSLRMNSILPAVLQRLTSVRELDLNSNGLTSVAESSFDKMNHLTHLNLRFNKISSIGKRTFQAFKLPNLKHLALSFNTIKGVKESTFFNLKSLDYLELNENAIQSVQKRSFEDLTSLRVLNLAGNKITDLTDEAFINLPRIQLLDLSHNDIKKFNIDAFEQLGTLSSFRIDLSYNKITRLGPEPIPLITFGKGSQETDQAEDLEEPATFTSPSPLHLVSISSSSVESLDLSHNNISAITPHFFGPISNTLIDLNLSHNRLSNLTRDHVSGMRFIQQLDLQHNILDTMEYDTFRESKLLQVLDLDHNIFRDMPPDLFEDCTNLRVFRASHNKIRSIPDTLFKDTQIEILEMRHNSLVRFPETALSKISSTLSRLDLTGNEISSIAPSQIECLQKLRWLNLASNRIVVIADSSFDTLFSLLYLDISGNPLGRVSSRLFEEAKNSLLHLHLSNMSLEMLPEFDTFPKLLTFNASFNSLTFLPTNFGVNVSSLRTLDISGNEISASPNTIWHTIPRLTSLLMNLNPIKSLSNESFLQLDRLHELDISDLPLEAIQVGLLSPLLCLRQLTLGPLKTDVANPGALIQSTQSLQHLHLRVNTPMLGNELRMFAMPEKLSKITISGLSLLSISNGAFQAIKNRQFHLEIQDTGLSDLGEGVLQSLGEASEIYLEITGNNSVLKSIGNPNSRYRKEPFATYLIDFHLDPNFNPACSCDAGWIEFWLRQWMEETCPVSTKSQHILHDVQSSSTCNTMLKSLRNVQCVNKPGSGLLKAFVNDLECGWESSASSVWNEHYVLHTFSVILTSWLGLIYGY